MYLTIKQPRSREEFLELDKFLKANLVKRSVDSIRYALSYCDYSSWDPKWTSISISTNSNNETWAEKCTASQTDKEISGIVISKELECQQSI